MKEQTPDKSCKQYAEQVSAWLDGQLSEDQSALVEAHLKDCPICAKQAEEYRILQNLIGAQRHKSPVDLTSTVMAGLEREQLLTGLEELSKPPTSRWVKRLRTLAAAAMIGLVIYAGSMVAQFAGSTSKPPRSTESFRQSLAEPSTGKTRHKTTRRNITRSPQSSRQIAINRDNQADISQQHTVRSEQLYIGTEGPVELKGSHTTEAQPRVCVTASATSGPAEPMMSKEGDIGTPLMLPPTLKPSRPLAIRPSEPLAGIPSVAGGKTVASSATHATSAITDAADTHQSRYLDQQVPLYYRLSVSDLPSWMLVKEQVVEILNRSDIPFAAEPDQAYRSLATVHDFYYQARKGLDLLPGSSTARILVCVAPEKFPLLQSRIQDTMMESVGQDMHPELRKLIKTQTVDPTLGELARSTHRNLRLYFRGQEMGISSHADQMEKSSATQPMTTTSVTTQTAEKKDWDNITLPFLIEIELNPRQPVSTATTSAPSTQP